MEKFENPPESIPGVPNSKLIGPVTNEKFNNHAGIPSKRSRANFTNMNSFNNVKGGHSLPASVDKNTNSFKAMTDFTSYGIPS